MFGFQTTDKMPYASALGNDSTVVGITIKDALDTLAGGGVIPPGIDTNIIYNAIGVWSATNSFTWHYAASINRLGIDLLPFQIPQGKIHTRATILQDNIHYQENINIARNFGWNWFYTGEADGFGINYNPAGAGVRIGTTATWDAVGRPSNLIFCSNGADMVTIDGVNDIITTNSSWVAINGEITFAANAAYGILYTRNPLGDGFLVLPEIGMAIMGSVRITGAGAFQFYNGLAWVSAGGGGSLQQSYDLGATIVPTALIGDIIFNVNVNGDFHIVNGTDHFNFDWMAANRLRLTAELFDYNIHIDATGTHSLTIDDGNLNFGTVGSGDINFTAVDNINFLSGSIRFADLSATSVTFVRNPLGDAVFILPEIGAGALLGSIGQVRVNTAGSLQWHNGVGWQTVGAATSLQLAYLGGNTIAPILASGNVLVDFAVNAFGSFTFRNGLQSVAFSYFGVNTMNMNAVVRDFIIGASNVCTITGAIGSTLTSTTGQTNVTASAGNVAIGATSGNINISTAVAGSINFNSFANINFNTGAVIFAALGATSVTFTRNAGGDCPLTLPQVGDGTPAIGEVRVNAAGDFQWHNGVGWQTAISALGATSLQLAYLGGNTIITTVIGGNILFNFAPNSTGAFTIQNGAQSVAFSYFGVGTMNMNATVRDFIIGASNTCTITGAIGTTLTSTTGQTNVTSSAGAVAIGATSGNVNITTTTSGNITAVPAVGGMIGLGIAVPQMFTHVQDPNADTTVFGIQTRKAINTGGECDFRMRQSDQVPMFSIMAVDGIVGANTINLFAGTGYSLNIGANNNTNVIQLSDAGTYIDFTVTNSSRFTSAYCYMHYTVSAVPADGSFTYDFTYAMWYNAVNDTFNIKARNGAAYPTIPLCRDLHTATLEIALDPNDEFLIWDTSMGVYRKTRLQDFNPRYRWFEQTLFIRLSTSQFTVVDNPINAAIFVKGVPLRYSDGTVYYGLVYNAVAAAGTITVTIAGAPMPAGVITLEYGDKELVQVVSFAFNGEYADADDATLLASDLRTAFKWTMGAGYVVMISHIHDKADTTVPPRLNARIAGAAVSTSNGNAGKNVALTWTDTDIDINTANYDIAFGDSIEVSADNAGTGDAANATIILTIITV